MSEDHYLGDSLLRQLINVGQVDLLVGVLSHKEANATQRAFLTIEQALRQHFVRQRAVIVNINGASSDGSSFFAGIPDAAASGQKDPRMSSQPSLRTLQTVTASFSIPPSNGTALRTILASADLMRAQACAVISPATPNLTPERIASLIQPIYREHCDFVAPLYARHKYEGLLARNLLYPMSRAVFGGGIRELVSDEWAFSERLARLCLNQDVWHEQALRERPEAWMAVSAMTADFASCQVFLGQKMQSPDDVKTDLVEILRQTVGTLFWCLEDRQDSWLNRDKPASVTTIGQHQELSSEETEVNQRRLFELFQTGVTELDPVLAAVLAPETHATIKQMASLHEDQFRFTPDIWVKTLYDFAASYHHAVINRDHLIQALAPLYRGMTYSFLVTHFNSSPAGMEADNEALCLEFERQKPYLKERWTKRVEVKS